VVSQIASVSWDMGDGNVKVGKTITHSYVASGGYRVGYGVLNRIYVRCGGFNKVNKELVIVYLDILKQRKKIG